MLAIFSLEAIESSQASLLQRNEHRRCASHCYHAIAALTSAVVVEWYNGCSLVLAPRLGSPLSAGLLMDVMHADCRRSSQDGDQLMTSHLRSSGAVAWPCIYCFGECELLRSRLRKLTLMSNATRLPAAEAHTHFALVMAPHLLCSLQHLHGCLW